MLFILNSDLQIIDTLSVKGIISQGNTPYFEDYYTQILATGAETFEFKTMANSRESRNIIVGNYIAFRDDNGDDKLFNIIETNESRSEQGFIKSVYCEMHGIELKNNIIRPMVMLNTSLEKFAETILSDTDWQVGEIDDFGGLLDINIGDHISVYDAIQKYAIGEFGAEIYYTVEIKSNSVVNKYLNIVENRGLDEGIKFTYNKNIQDIERTIDTSNLCTALIGVGNNGLTFKNVETSDKPLNQDFIVNETAYQQWSKNGYHIFGYETFETDSDQELLKLTRNKLYERGTPRVKYELNVELLDADVRIGDYIRITDMEFEPPIMLEARISTLTKSKTDINGNQCEISNFKHLQSNITDQMRKLSSNLKGYADNINIDNISKGGFLSSKITVVDESTLGIGNQVETGKDFCVDFKNLTAETVLTDFVLPNKKVMQQAIVDYHENKIYISCDETSNGNVMLYQTDMSGEILGQMTLNQFGHSNSFGIERRDNRTYIWLECDAKQAYSSEPEKLRGTKLCYFEFKNGVTANKTYGTVIDILPGWLNLSLGIDDTYNQIAVRALDEIGGTYYYHVFDLDEVISGTFEAKYKFKDVGLQGTSSYQGFDILGNYIYAIQGAGYYTHPPKMDSYVTCIDIQNGKKRYVNLIDILPDAPFREIEGIKVIKKSERVYELNFGMVTEHQSPRKNHVFKYTYTIPLKSNPQGKFVHPNGWTTSISEGLIKVDSSKKRNYLMYVVDGERFKFEEGFSKQIIMANYENGIWYCNGEEFKPMANDCIIGTATPNQDNYFDLTIYSESSQSLGSTLSGSSDSLMYEDGKIIVNAGGLVGQLPTDLIEVESINANHISANAITADKIQSNSIESKHIKAEVFEAINADIENLVAGKAEIEDLKATNAQIENLKVNKADIEQLNATKGEITQLKSEVAEIGFLKGDIADIENILAGNITADNIASGTITSDKIQAGTITSGSGIIADGAIGNAQISSLEASKISSGTIDTSKVTVQGANGHLRIKGNRLQVFNGTGSNATERVSVGDVNGDGTVYGLRVRGTDGTTVLLDENGVTSEGITDGSITNEKVSDDANIDGAKLNINSVVSKLNEDGTEVIKGTKIEVNGTSLVTQLSTMTSKQTEQGEKISQNTSSIKTNENAIKLKVDSQTYQADKINMTSTLNKHTSEISTLQDEISLKVEQTDIETANNALKSEIQEDLNDINERINDILSDVGGAIADGIIEEAETMVINNSIAQLNKEKETLTQRYNYIYNLSTLASSMKSQLKSDMDNYTTKQSNLISHIQAMIVDKNISDSERRTYNTRLSEYSAALASVNKKIEECMNSISTNKIDTAKAEIKVTTDSISQSVTNLSNTVSTKADGSTVTTLSNKVGSLETSVNGITQRVSSVESATSTVARGNNKWRIDIYNLSELGIGTGATPTPSMIHGKAPNSSLLEERPAYSHNHGTNFLGHAKTNVYLDSAYTWNTSITTDDAGCVYLNGKHIVNTASCVATSITLSFIPGWNTIEVYFIEGGGGDCFNFGSHLQDMSTFKEMNAYIETGLTSSIKTVESKMTDSAITNIVSQNFYTKTQTESAITSKGYATTSQVQQTKDDLTATFKESGGYNLLRNGCANLDTSYWYSNGGGISRALNASGGYVGNYFTTSMPSGITGEWVRLKNNVDYVYQAKIYLPNGSYTGSGSTPLHYWCSTSQTSGSSQLTVLDYSATIPQNGWTQCYVHFKTKASGNVWFKPFIYTGSGTQTIYVTELMLSESKVVLPYSPHPSEIYDGITKIDKDGIQVSQSNISTTTKMNANGFYINKGGTDVFKVDSGGLTMRGNIQGSTFSSANDIFQVLSDGTVETDDINVSGTVSTEILSVGKISNSKYPEVLDKAMTVYIKNGASSPDDFYHGAVYGSFKDMLAVAPRNLQGYTLDIVMQSNITENVSLTWFTSGQVDISFQGFTLYGYLYCYGASMVYRLYGGNGNDAQMGKIMPSCGRSMGSYYYALAFQYCQFAVNNIGLYPDTTNTTNSGGICANRGARGNIFSATAYGSMRYLVRSEYGSHVYVGKTSGTCNNATFCATTGSIISLNNDNAQAGRSTSGNPYWVGSGGMIVNNQVLGMSNITFGTTANSGSNTNTSTGSTQTITETITASLADTYRSTVYNNWKKDGTVRQGEWGYGNCTGLWFFDNKLSSALSKGTTRSVSIKITRQSGGNSGAVTHTLKVHNHATRPSGAPTMGNTITTFSLATGASTTLNLTSAQINTLKSGKGIGLQSSYSNSTYSVCSGTITIKVTYTT